MRRLRYVVFVILVSIASAGAVYPGDALAMDSQAVRDEFSSSELSRLLYEVDGIEGCDFVMHDYEKNETSYLRVRTSYRGRYESLVGDDSVDVARSDARPRGILPGHDLSAVENPSLAPWCNVLYLSGLLMTGDVVKGSLEGTAFMVSDKLAVTAAHCVYGQGSFASRLNVQSSFDNANATAGRVGARYALVTPEYIESAPPGAGDENTDSDQDYALLVLESNPPGTSAASYLSYESITVFDSLANPVNCAGWADLGAGERLCLYVNGGWGSVSLADPDPLGNAFRVNLSMVRGMSGGPVYCLGNDGSYVAVGVISRGSSASYACRITERLQVLVAWAEESGWLRVDPDPAPPSAGSSEEPRDAIGIFAPSVLWEDEMGGL